MTKVNWLDGLQALIETLRERIANHREHLQTNETATRYALIDPLLTALGWDLSDPSQVLAEYPAKDGGKFDYAMLLKGKPRLVLEAKNLGTSQLDRGIDQAILYCVKQGIEYFVVTNGDHWQGYKLPFEPVFDFRVSDATRPGALRVLWLWQGNFLSGDHPEQPPKAPPGKPQEPRGAIERGSVRDPVGPSNGQRLDSFEPKKGDKVASIRFVDGHVEAISRWYELQTKVVAWLLDKGAIRHTPLMNDRGNFLVNTVPRNKAGRDWKNPKKVGNLWVDTNCNAPNHVKRSQVILRACGEDPSSVVIELVD